MRWASCIVAVALWVTLASCVGGDPNAQSAPQDTPPTADSEDDARARLNDAVADGEAPGETDTGLDADTDGGGDGEPTDASAGDPQPTPIAPVKANPTYEVTTTEDVVYGQGLTCTSWGSDDCAPMDLLLDLYEPVGAPDVGKPVLMVIHGGGFKQGSHKAAVFKSFAQHFVQRGWVAASLTYRVMDHKGALPSDWPALVSDVVDADQVKALYPAGRDVKAAARWLRSQSETLGIHPESFVALGGSAGGFLSLLLGVSDEDDYKTELTEADDPTLATTHLEQASGVQAIIDLWGGTALLDVLQERDGVSRWDASDAPVIILHGTEDASVPFSEGEAVKAHYEASGAPFVWKPLEGWGHSAWQAEVSGKSLAEVSHHFATTALDLTVDKD